MEKKYVLDWQHDYLHNAYPVYSLNYVERVELILKALKRFKNLELAGRNGLFFYSHLHDQMRFGKDLIEKLLEKQLEASKSVAT
jgi:protoporphyrinogen oxidase